VRGIFFQLSKISLIVASSCAPFPKDNSNQILLKSNQSFWKQILPAFWQEEDEIGLGFVVFLQYAIIIQTQTCLHTHLTIL